MKKTIAALLIAGSLAPVAFAQSADVSVTNPSVCTFSSATTSVTVTPAELDSKSSNADYIGRGFDFELYCNTPYQVEFSSTNGALVNQDAVTQGWTGGVAEIPYSMRTENKLDTDGDECSAGQINAGLACATRTSNNAWADLTGSLQLQINRSRNGGNDPDAATSRSLYAGLFSDTFGATITATP